MTFDLKDHFEVKDAVGLPPVVYTTARKTGDYMSQDQSPFVVEDSTAIEKLAGAIDAGPAPRPGHRIVERESTFCHRESDRKTTAMTRSCGTSPR